MIVGDWLRVEELLQEKNLDFKVSGRDLLV